MSVIIVSKENKEILIASDGYCGNGTEKGICGADMKVSLVNDGPVTLILEK